MTIFCGVGKPTQACFYGDLHNQVENILYFDVFPPASSKKPHRGTTALPFGKAFIGGACGVIEIIGI